MGPLSYMRSVDGNVHMTAIFREALLATFVSYFDIDAGIPTQFTVFCQ